MAMELDEVGDCLGIDFCRIWRRQGEAPLQFWGRSHVPAVVRGQDGFPKTGSEGDRSDSLFNSCPNFSWTEPDVWLLYWHLIQQYMACKGTTTSTMNFLDDQAMNLVLIYIFPIMISSNIKHSQAAAAAILIILIAFVSSCEFAVKLNRFGAKSTFQLHVPSRHSHNGVDTKR